MRTSRTLQLMLVATALAALAGADHRAALAQPTKLVYALPTTVPAVIPYVALDPKETATVQHAAVAFTTATYGINVPGTVYRMDDVPIPLRPAFESPYPSDEEVLRRIERRVRELQQAVSQ